MALGFGDQCSNWYQVELPPEEVPPEPEAETTQATPDEPQPVEVAELPKKKPKKKE